LFFQREKVKEREEVKEREKVKEKEKEIQKSIISSEMLGAIKSE